MKYDYARFVNYLIIRKLHVLKDLPISCFISRVTDLPVPRFLEKR